MERESFEDEEVASLLNRDFVCIKLDREERPDVDHFYMEACMRATGRGGWPLSIFMNYDRIPFYAGTYFPKEAGYGLIGFPQLLEKISLLWKNERAWLLENGLELLSAMEEETDLREETDRAPQLAYEQFLDGFDERYGGFGPAPKFPAVSNLLFLIRYGKLFPGSDASAMVGKTLSSMERGGLFDHIGGGFFRYSTDREWLVPHFEKMAYDNALLLMIYGEAAATIDDRFRKTAERTAEYMLHTMRGEHGGFYTAQDADSEGGEGSTYLWTPEEVKAFWALKKATGFAGFSISRRRGILKEKYPKSDSF
jgi:uncharacterized protein YyaL (SSP411 family)